MLEDAEERARWKPSLPAIGRRHPGPGILQAYCSGAYIISEMHADNDLRFKRGNTCERFTDHLMIMDPEIRWFVMRSEGLI